MATKKKNPKKNTQEPKPPGAPTPGPKVERFQQNLRCELTEEELLERSRRQSRLLSQKALLIEEAKSRTAHLKADIKQIDAEISRTVQEVNDGACFRDVACERHYIYSVGVVAEIRCDTGAQTYERPMTDAERQLELPVAKKPLDFEWEDPPKEDDGEPPAADDGGEPESGPAASEDTEEAASAE